MSITLIPVMEEELLTNNPAPSFESIKAIASGKLGYLFEAIWNGERRLVNVTLWEPGAIVAYRPHPPSRLECSNCHDDSAGNGPALAERERMLNQGILGS